MNYNRITEMVEHQIKESNEYDKRSFGEITGEDFAETCKGALASRELRSHLMLSLLLGAISGREIADELKQSSDADPSEALKKAIMNNARVFEPQLSLLYWGIRIGRELEREESDTLKKIEADSL